MLVEVQDAVFIELLLASTSLLLLTSGFLAKLLQLLNLLLIASKVVFLHLSVALQCFALFLGTRASIGIDTRCESARSC